MAGNIPIRLTIEGRDDAKRAFAETNAAGQEMGRNVATALDTASAASDRLTDKVTKAGAAARTAQAQAAAGAAAQGGSAGAPASGGVPQSSPKPAPLPTPSPTTSREVERLRYLLDEEYRKERQLGTAQDKIGRGLSGGFIGEEEATRLRTLAAVRYGSGSQNDNDPSRRGLDSYQKRDLMYQGGDVVASLGSGAGLGTVAFQQGPQILQGLAGGEGGLKGGLKALGESALGLVTPMTVGATAVLGAGAAFAYLAAQAAKGQEALEGSTKGVGAGTGATVSQLDGIARANAEAGKVSTVTSQQIVASYASIGTLAVPVINDLTRVTADYARITGQDAVSAAAELGRAVADGGTALDAVAAKMGGLSDATRQLIQTQQEQGDKSGAQQTAADALKASIDANAASVGGLASQWNTATAAVGNYLAQAGKAAAIKIGLIPEAAGDAVTRLQTIVDAANNNRRAIGLGPVSPVNNEDARKLEVAKVIADQDRMIAEGKAAEQRAIAASVAAGAVSRQVDPNFARVSQLKEQQTALRDALADPLARSKLADPSQAEAAYTATTRALTTLTDASGKMISMEEMSRRQDQLKIDSLNAKTDAEKKSVAERQKAFDLIGKTLTPSDARGQIGRAGFISGLESSSKGGGGSKGGAAEKTDDYDRGLKSIEDRIRRQEQEVTTFGMGADAVARYRTEQELLTAAKRADRDVSATLTDQIKEYAEKAAQAAQRMEQLRDSMRTIDSMRGMGSDVFRSLGGDLVRGASAADLFGNAATRLKSSVANMLSDQLAEGFFGKRGSSSGWLAEFFGSNGGTAGASSGGGVLSFVKSMFGASDGRVPGYAEGRVPLLSREGIVSGPGTTTSDSIPAWISDREAIIKASSVERYGPAFIKSINDGTFRYSGGWVPDPTPEFGDEGGFGEVLA